MASQLYTQSYIDSLVTLRDGILAQITASPDGSSALWEEYEIRNRRHKRMSPLEGIKYLNELIAIAESAINSRPARNQARFCRNY